jgi:pilus assembly protein TadC
MKKLFSFLLITLIFSLSKAQTNDSLKISIQENMPIDSIINRKMKALKQPNAFENKKVETKNGTYFLEGLIGGFLGSTLAAVATSENGFYGAGPKIVIGTLVTSIIGLMIPREKKINPSKN